MSFVKFKKVYGFVKHGSSMIEKEDCDILIRTYENCFHYIENQLLDWKDLSIPLGRNYILYDLNWEKILETSDLSVIEEYLDK